MIIWTESNILAIHLIMIMIMIMIMMTIIIIIIITIRNVNCSGWKMRIWTESKGRPVVKESVDIFCAQVG